MEKPSDLVCESIEVMLKNARRLYVVFKLVHTYIKTYDESLSTFIRKNVRQFRKKYNKLQANHESVESNEKVWAILVTFFTRELSYLAYIDDDLASLVCLFWQEPESYRSVTNLLRDKIRGLRLQKAFEATAHIDEDINLWYRIHEELEEDRRRWQLEDLTLTEGSSEASIRGLEPKQGQL